MKSLSEVLYKKTFVRRKQTQGKDDFVYGDKTVGVETKKHYDMLCKTLMHLEALKSVYERGSANRHILSQTCSRLKRLIARLEKNLD
ncbi:MAG: hypothetical protein E6R04_07570 [Spirochaetes bacterium]|jgi:hypothetical protein|nr:MAG: hypothetical protein E6R04_07570 [Spirochaetota bacterium]